MASPEVYAAREPGDLMRLLKEYPLCWIVSGTGEDFRATLLPLRATADAEGGVGTLVGHFARTNEQVEFLKADPRAVILALGPNGYVSPSWMEDRTQAPTWNYASAQFHVELEFFESSAEITAHLQDLVSSQEAARDNAWRISEMGPRYSQLATRIIGFRARVSKTAAKFKLGQDERSDVYPDITRGLEQAGAGELLKWMGRFNSGR